MLNKLTHTFSSKALIALKTETSYLALVMILVPLINFLSGIAIDLYAPSMPAIAISFHTSTMAVKNTISATMLGFGMGCLLCGILFDMLGRRKIIITALIIFVISSLLAPFCHSISQLIIIRFIQGLMTSAMSIGCRTIASDHFTGHQFVVAILYSSFAYGLGPVVGPFIGGYLQEHLGWQANFYAFAVFGMIVLALFILFVNERFKKLDGFTFIHALQVYKSAITHKIFLLGAFISGFIQLELMLYPTLGPFLVEHELHYSAVTYGNSALLVGLGYLSGTLSNRFLLKYLSQNQLINVGFAILALSCLIQFTFSLWIGLNLWTLVFPIILMGYAAGFIFGNILAYCIKLFPNNVGISLATVSSLLMLLASLGVFAISSMKITALLDLFFICFGIIAVQLFLYVFYRRQANG